MTDEDDKPLPAFELRSLRPNYVEAEHGLYVSLLTADIAGEDPSRNVAVSGAYGSGKSSVLEGLQTKLDEASLRTIQVSLATLNQSRDSLLEVSGEATLTAALEKEVVKRLLYSARPSQIPRSRFNRIVGFRPWPAAGLATVVSVLVVGAAKTFGLSLPMSQLSTALDWWTWVGSVLDILSVGIVVFAAQAALSSFRLSQIAVGPATLSLDDKDGNYFDHFLDEIIYFFQRTKTRVVLFEDLDRFNDPGIFLALRELNNLLNSSQQIDQRVTFVYAIRDSLFVPAADADVDPQQGTSALDEHQGADSPASNRAKFFDLIVPLVPFISHEVAADLLVNALVDLPDRLRPTRALVTLVGRHFSDMRVVLSIRNEYMVFARELLEKSAVRGLKPDQMFAMVAYKHLHLDDFERIRTGQSRLDAAVDCIRETAATMLKAADAAIAEVEDSIKAAKGIDRRSKASGDRLLALLDVTLRVRRWQPVSTITVDSTKVFQRSDVARRDFWTTLAESESPKLTVDSPNGNFEVESSDLEAFLGADRDPKRWIANQLQRDRQRLSELKQARAWLLGADFADLLAGPFPTARLDESHPWEMVAEACGAVVGFGLPHDLLGGGYLDQNFALYTTKFHGAILSANARTYLMQYVDRHRAEPLFALTNDDVDQLLERLGEGFLADPSALNVAIVDRILATDSRHVPLLLETPGQATDFLLTYLANGQHGDDLLRRIAGERVDILDVVGSAASMSEDDRRDALSICLSALSLDLDYSADLATAQAIEDGLDDMPVLRDVLEPETAAAIGRLLASIDVRVADLSRVAEPLLSEVASNGCFVVDRANLEAISGRIGRIGLDSLGGTTEGTGKHMIVALRDYLEAVRQVPTASVVDDPARLDEVVRAITANDPGDLRDALRLVADGIEYRDLADAPASAYSDLAHARAFALTRQNVTEYIVTVGELDEDLAAFLSDVGAIEVSDDDSDGEEAERQALVEQIVRSDYLAASTKVALVISLRTAAHLDVGALDLTDPQVASELLAAGEIRDQVETFDLLAQRPWPVFEACAASSSEFGSFAASIAYTDDLLAQVLTSPRLSDDVKVGLLRGFDSVEGFIGTKSAAAWMDTADRLQVGLTLPQVQVLASAGAKSDQLVQYLTTSGASLSAAEVVDVLAHCEGVYADLSSPDGRVLSVPYAENFRSVLETLKRGGVVAAFHKKRLRSEFHVQMAG